MTGKILLILGVSGAGKSTLQKALQTAIGWLPIISYTTRAPRPGEVDGVDYHFVTQQQFDAMRRDLCETATVHGNEYGLLGMDLRGPVLAGETRTLVIDHQGAAVIRSYLGRASTPAVLVQVDRHEQHARLIARGTDSVEAIRRRVDAYSREVAGCEQLATAVYASGNLSELMSRVIHHTHTFSVPEGQ